ncbi:MAG: hypothetical protein ACK40X_01000 [Armatimonadota bacterium]
MESQAEKVATVYHRHFVGKVQREITHTLMKAGYIPAPPEV